MSGIGSSLEDLDKGVRKSVPGGWGTVAGLAAGGAGLYYGLGASAAGAAGSAGTSTLGAGTATAATGATTAATGAGAIEAAGVASGAAGISNPFASSAAYQAAIPGLTSSGAGSQAAMLAAQTGEFGLGGLAHTAGSAYAPGSFGSGAWGALAAGKGVSPTQALMANRALGGFGQQQQGGQASSVGLRQGQPVNTADPIAALLAPKMKKKERISLL